MDEAVTSMPPRTVSQQTGCTSADSLDSVLEEEEILRPSSRAEEIPNRKSEVPSENATGNPLDNSTGVLPPRRTTPRLAPRRVRGPPSPSDPKDPSVRRAAKATTENEMSGLLAQAPRTKGHRT